MKPGSVLLFDDVGATIGHGGRIGPCVYTSLSIKPALRSAPEPKPAP